MFFSVVVSVGTVSLATHKYVRSVFDTLCYTMSCSVDAFPLLCYDGLILHGFSKSLFHTGSCFWRSDHSNVFTITIQQTPTVEMCKSVVLTFYMKINVFGDVLQLPRTGTQGKVTYRAGSEATYCFPHKQIQ